jgi:hypothetical protein
MRLVILRDGRVAARDYGEPDRVLDREDPLALTQAFRAFVEFEEGLTSAQLFRALRPWAAVLSRAAWMDFDAWQTSATRAPLQLVTEEANACSGAEPPLDAVVIHPVLSVHRDDANEGKDVAIAIHWRTSGRYVSPRSNGFGGEDIFCSLSFAPPQTWAHLPLLIDPTVEVDEDEALRNASPTISATTEARLLASPKFFDAIILGFLDDVSFHGSPLETAEVGDEIARRVAEFSSRAEHDPP